MLRLARERGLHGYFLFARKKLMALVWCAFLIPSEIDVLTALNGIPSHQKTKIAASQRDEER